VPRIPDDVHEARVEFAYNLTKLLLPMAKQKAMVCAYCNTQGFPITPRGAERVIRVARNRLRDESGVSREEHRINCHGQLMRIFQNKKASEKAIIAAVDKYAKLYGCYLNRWDMVDDTAEDKAERLRQFMAAAVKTIEVEREEPQEGHGGSDSDTRNADKTEPAE
jgi:uncharacterized Zn-finger protein